MNDFCCRQSDLCFGMYLVEKGMLSEQEVFEVITQQKKKRVLLGSIAIKKKFLTVKQVMAILDDQCNSKRKFGELAIEMGFLTQEQLLHLLDSQLKENLTLIDFIAKSKDMDKKELDKELFQFLKESRNKEVGSTSLN